MGGIATSAGPTPDLDALIERKPDTGHLDRDLEKDQWIDEAAAALVQLREENARLNDEGERERIRLAACGVAALGYHRDGDSIHPDYESASLSDVHRLTAKLERAEAEVARLKSEVEFLHKRRGEIVIDRDRYRAALGKYPEGRDVMLGGALAEVERSRERIAALEAERADLIKINNKWAGEWDAMREERDALAGTISQQIDALQRLVCERDMLNADAERYRFIRSPLAGDSGVVQKELWVEFCYKTCREDKMDALIDGAMRLLRYHIDAAKEKP